MMYRAAFAFNVADGEATTRSFPVLDLRVGAYNAHGADHLVEQN